jgi:hypothetical protein
MKRHKKVAERKEVWSDTDSIVSHNTRAKVQRRTAKLDKGRIKPEELEENHSLSESS